MDVALRSFVAFVCIALSPYGPGGVGLEDASFVEIGSKGMKIDEFALACILGVRVCVKLRLAGSIMERLHATYIPNYP